MTTYHVAIRTCMWTTHTVEAETPEEAAELAMETDGTDEHQEFDGISSITDDEGQEYPIPVEFAG